MDDIQNWTHTNSDLEWMKSSGQKIGLEKQSPGAPRRATYSLVHKTGSGTILTGISGRREAVKKARNWMRANPVPPRLAA
jgi:hypothetical protein